MGRHKISVARVVFVPITVVRTGYRVRRGDRHETEEQHGRRQVKTVGIPFGAACAGAIHGTQERRPGQQERRTAERQQTERVWSLGYD